MSSPWIEAVRSVALNVPDLAKAEAFYTEVWRLSVAHRGEQAIYLRGTGSDHHLLALHAGGPVPQIRQVTLRARSLEALSAVAQAVPRAGGELLSPIGPLHHDPAGGTGLTLRDPHGRVLQVVHGDARGRDAGPQRDQPARLTHVVLNSHAVDDTQRFLTEALGFTLADRTVAIAFMNCNHDHHTLAVGVADNDALNHIAFLMPDADSVMRGGGRMKDAGHPIEWAPAATAPATTSSTISSTPSASSSSTRPRSSRWTKAMCHAARRTGSGHPAVSTSGASRPRPAPP